MKFVKEMPKDAVEIHMYNWENVLMPRGSGEKESIYEYLFPRLVATFESWIDPKYGDNPDQSKLLNKIYDNLLNETLLAWEDFLLDQGIVPPERIE